MALPSSGTLSLSQIKNEFGGSTPDSLSEYYAGGLYVPDPCIGVNGPVPSSGEIKISDFYGTDAIPNAGTLYITSMEYIKSDPAGSIYSAASDTHGWAVAGEVIIDQCWGVLQGFAACEPAYVYDRFNNGNYSGFTGIGVVVETTGTYRAWGLLINGASVTTPLSLRFVKAAGAFAAIDYSFDVVNDRQGYFYAEGPSFPRTQVVQHFKSLPGGATLQQVAGINNLLADMANPNVAKRIEYEYQL